MNPRHRGTSSRRSARVALVVALVVGSLGAASPAAAAELDFGSVAVGESTSQSFTVPLSYALSSLPGNTVVYDGGNSAINLSLGALGLNAPVTASELLTTIGDVVAHYHVFFGSTAGLDFSVDSSDCVAGAGSCLAVITFHPTVEGDRTATIFANLVDVQTSGGGSFATLISLLAPFVANAIEPQLNVAVSGVGTEGLDGGVILRVGVEPEPEPCLIVDVTSLDFGVLPFSTEGGVSSSGRNLNVVSCSTGDESVYATGTDATGDGEPAGAWALTDAEICDGTANVYGVQLIGVVGTQDPQSVRVTTDQRGWLELQPNDTAATEASYLMPCQGSTGAGQTMTSQVIFTAVIE